MIQVITEYLVSSDQVGHFKLLFGPGGTWSGFFNRSPGFRGAAVLADQDNKGRILVIESWSRLENRTHVLNENQSDYQKIETQLQKFSESIHRVGVFRLNQDAGVRPR